jgi:hypothetical protein
MVVRIEWMQFASKWVAPQEYRLVPWKEFHEMRRFLFRKRRAHYVGFSMAPCNWRNKKILILIFKGDLKYENIP